MDKTLLGYVNGVIDTSKYKIGKRKIYLKVKEREIAKILSSIEGVNVVKRKKYFSIIFEKEPFQRFKGCKEFEDKKFRIGYIRAVFDMKAKIYKKRKTRKKKYKLKRNERYFLKLTNSRKSAGYHRLIRIIGEKNYIKFLQNLLTSEKINSTVYNLKVCNKYEYSCLEIYNKVNCKKFLQKIGFSIKRKEEKLKNIVL